MTTRSIRRLVGVYDADGGLVGEAKYVVGALLGRAHCSLCDITHSPIRRKPDWDRMVERLPMPFELRHRNEVAGPVSTVVAAHPLPLVLAEHDDDTVAVVIDAAELAGMNASVEQFEVALARALAAS